MLNWLPTGLLAKRTAKVAAIRLNALFRWHTVPSGDSTILSFAPVALENIDYLPAEYFFDRGFHSLILGRDDWNYDMIVLPDVLVVYTDGSKLDKTGPEHLPSAKGLL